MSVRTEDTLSLLMQFVGALLIYLRSCMLLVYVLLDDIKIATHTITRMIILLTCVK